MTSSASDPNNAHRILAVDDEIITRRTIKKSLEKSGYEVITASDGSAAVEICAARLPDLVLLDVVMPGIDGFETCAELRKIAGYNYLPILMLTGLDDMESIDKAFSAGSTDFITKPLNWPLLRQRVRYALRQRELYRQLQLSERQLAKAQSIAKLGYWEVDTVENLITLLPETQTLLGLEQRNYRLSEFVDHLADEDKDAMLASIGKLARDRDSYSIEHAFTTIDGRELTISQQGEYGEAGDQTIVGTFQDITERKQAEDLIYFHTYFDPRTSLPNRAYLDRQVSGLLQKGDDDRLTGVFAISFDRMRDLGTSVGNEAIDLFLKQAAERIRADLDGVVDVARLGSTTLGFLLHDVPSLEHIEEFCVRCRQLFRDPLEVSGHRLHSGVSIGVTAYPVDANPVSLINNSLTALRVCIGDGGGDDRIYSQDMDASARDQIQLEVAIRAALLKDEFVCYYQPQVEAATGRVIGMEALSRWLKPDGSMVPPDEFIPISEKTDIIVELGQHVLETACEFTTSLQNNAIGSYRVGVNLSARQFAQKNIVDIIKRQLEATKIPPQLLEVEITEGIAMTDISYAITTLSELRNLGIKTSMDDFGTGYSSLSYLQKLPLDTLKIDQSFIRPIGVDGENSEIARAVIAMGHSLKMHLIAEGVEHAYQYELMRELGCHEVQGYYVAKPLSPNDFYTYVESHGDASIVS